MSWPKNGVDVLEARNINRGFLYKNDNCRCAIGWLEHWFGIHTKEYLIVRRIAQDFIGDVLITHWNDDPERPKSEIAQTINKITARAGYVVNNPEAENI